MKNLTETQLSESPFNSLLNGGTQSLIPQSLQTLLFVSFIVINIAAVLFVVAYIFSLVRKWKVQTAVLHMQTDVSEIKQSLKTLVNTGPPETKASDPYITAVSPDEKSPTLEQL